MLQVEFIATKLLFRPLESKIFTFVSQSSSGGGFILFYGIREILKRILTSIYVNYNSPLVLDMGLTFPSDSFILVDQNPLRKRNWKILIILLCLNTLES